MNEKDRINKKERETTNEKYIRTDQREIYKQYSVEKQRTINIRRRRRQKEGRLGIQEKEHRSDKYDERAITKEKEWMRKNKQTRTKEKERNRRNESEISESESTNKKKRMRTNGPERSNEEELLRSISTRMNEWARTNKTDQWGEMNEKYSNRIERTYKKELKRRNERVRTNEKRTNENEWTKNIGRRKIERTGNLQTTKVRMRNIRKRKDDREIRNDNFSIIYLEIISLLSYLYFYDVIILYDNLEQDHRIKLFIMKQDVRFLF